MRAVLALEGPPTVDSSSPNASALALLLVRYKQQRTSVSEQTKLMLDMLGGADSVLRLAAHETHLVCERSVVRPPPDLSDLSDSDDDTSDGGEAFTDAGSVSPEFPEPCDHVPDTSGPQASNSDSAWACHDDGNDDDAFSDVPDTCPLGYTPTITRVYATPEMRAFFESARRRTHANVRVSDPCVRVPPPRAHVSLHSPALGCAGRQDGQKKGSNDSASAPSRDSPRAGILRTANNALRRDLQRERRRRLKLEARVISLENLSGRLLAEQTD